MREIANGINVYTHTEHVMLVDIQYLFCVVVENHRNSFIGFVRMMRSSCAKSIKRAVSSKEYGPACCVCVFVRSEEERAQHANNSIICPSKAR